ncbi:ubiquinone biosynthesis regulatory protein kinase UbiB [Wohlfahrtiimonas chitiniclastica]|uniref:Ubiquinone biosynthesis regulatory protein kinase UbiB n=1 Tax=Wohlfahrtiimonas chitiniclastica TaxID=400946 RepID=A0AB35BYA9_9GAMM|nr:ubiquinone biosynthesis regulatory protein kinase UbiB [Wohlfahrtiimonas chitiniclastica]KZX36438.1 ubiquinone biosynthesis regulatory protein kinase UbiB [Wohlfahrtiimonas chitiniclastica]MBS7824724.1 ubiquinone biosynthesis regulatory protein kinase UbiB [Wohlfahrtiimonas chitiniclastica]MBS7836959.1 ubiquinone biosynthesis regulatory protein kinase UbiB [Wohlfahrtiimonas chitiniclastica]MBS7839035.1 ubiquinone biosynthesis regulatory protein kinase UbiB [Wohlfahrtiimonas chitiniclastica]
MFSRWLRALKIHWILMRYGLYELVFLIPFFRLFVFLKPLVNLLNKYKDTPLPVRIRLALEALGPTFVKLGQVLSTRNDLFPEDYIEEFSKLQDNVPAFDSNIAIEIIERALKQPISEVFREFDEVPMAAASIAQVHSAILKNGDHVVVKVVRPNIQKVILRDVQLMEMIAEAVEEYVAGGDRLRPVEVVAEYKRTILSELDLTREAANGLQLKRNFEGSHEMYVPHIYLEYTSKNIMVMEKISGIPVDHVETLRDLGVNIPKLAELSVEVFFKQVFVDSFFHADMHPGNIFVDATDPANPSYIALDYGIIGTLGEEDKHYLASNFLAFFNRDYRRVAELHVESGWVPADTSIEELESAIRSICEPIFNKPLSEISFGGLLLSLFQTGRRFNMVVQPQLVLLQKTLFNIEGIGRKLYPELDLWKTAKPFLVKFVKNQKSAKTVLRKYQNAIPSWIDHLPDAMQNLYLISQDMVRGQFKTDLNEKTLEKYQKIQAKQTTRKVYGLLGAATLVATIVSWHNLEDFLGVFLILLAVFAFYQALRE